MDPMQAVIAQMQAEKFAREALQLTEVQRGVTITHGGETFRLDVVGRYRDTNIVVFRAIYQTPELLASWKADRAAFEAAMEADRRMFEAARAVYARQGLDDMPSLIFVAQHWDPAVSTMIKDWYASKNTTINLVVPQ